MRLIHCAVHRKIVLCPSKSVNATTCILMLLWKADTCGGIRKVKPCVVFILVFSEYSSLSTFVGLLKFKEPLTRYGVQKLCPFCKWKDWCSKKHSHQCCHIVLGTRKDKIQVPWLVFWNSFSLNDIDLAQPPALWPLDY